MLGDCTRTGSKQSQEVRFSQSFVHPIALDMSALPNSRAVLRGHLAQTESISQMELTVSIIATNEAVRRMSPISTIGLSISLACSIIGKMTALGRVVLPFNILISSTHC